MIDYDFFKAEADKIGVELDDYALSRFDSYAERLVKWNEHINLTAITNPQEIVIKHFIDCLYILKYIEINGGEKLIDVGTGAGFPAMPLLIARPQLEVTFLDSVKKKLNFINDVLMNLGLFAEVRHERAEQLAHSAKYREQYDFATARAVAPLNILSEYCLPFVKNTGSFISLKGSAGEEEMNTAKNAIETLGGKIEKFENYYLQNENKRSIIIVKKISQTPTKYPRKSKKIDTRPL